MKQDRLKVADAEQLGHYGSMCVVCRKHQAGRRGGYIPRPVDRRPAGVRCGWCYRRYLRKYFPGAA